MSRIYRIVPRSAGAIVVQTFLVAVVGAVAYGLGSMTWWTVAGGVRVSLVLACLFGCLLIHPVQC